MCGSNSSNFQLLGKRLNRSQGFYPNKMSGITVSVCKCKKCGLIFSNPLPIPESFMDHYGLPPGEYWQEEYFDVQPDYFSGEIDWLKQLINSGHGTKALDVGAGIGKCMRVLERNGFDVYGLEPSEPFYNMAVGQMKIDPGHIYPTSIEEADLPENFFSFITFGAVLEHLNDPAGAIERSLQWLKKDGIIHIEVPSSRWLISRLINRFYKIRGLDYSGNLSPMHPPFHLYEFSIESFEENSKKLNYSIADYGYYVGKTYMPGIIDFFIKPYMKWTNSGMQLVVWLKKN
ncbi:MAG: class I SAM-dependent methyltransferase [Cyclobacteriaceae bacterium]|nr:class I SAM-dependent methyltransferase [Cyclobacteriaceae bacterium]